MRHSCETVDTADGVGCSEIGDRAETLECGVRNRGNAAARQGGGVWVRGRVHERRENRGKKRKSGALESVGAVGWLAPTL